MSSAARRWTAVVGLLAMSWAAGCGSACRRSGPREKASGESVTVEVNAKAPAFAVKTLTGTRVRLADYVGRNVVLLEFWSIFCKSCIEEMPHIEELQEEYGPRGFQVLSVNTDVFSADKIASFMEKAGIRPPYPVLRDVRQEIVEAYGVELLPVTVIVDREGWIRLYQEGYRPGDERRFEATVRSLVGGEEAEDVTLAASNGVTTFAPAGVELAEAGQRFAGCTAVDLTGARRAVPAAGPHLFYFWSLYCNPCRNDYPRVAELARRYRSLRAYGVNVDTPRLGSRVERFVADHRGLVNLIDDPTLEAGGVARLMGVRVTPTVILTDADGTVVHAESGVSDLGTLEERLRSLGAPKTL